MKSLRRLLLLVPLLLISLNFFSPALMIAQAQAPSSDLANCPPGTPAGTTCLRNPIGTTSIPTLIARIINAALGIVGSIAFLMFVYGGFLWLTSGGSSEQVKKGQDVMKWAAIGLVIIFSSYGLVRLVFRAVGAA